MASEKAKALAAKQKAELQAEKLRRKNSTDPADWGRIRQIKEAYKATAKVDKPLPWIMAGERVTRKLDALVRISGKPDCIISDSGTEFTSKARPGSPTRSCSWRLPWC